MTEIERINNSKLIEILQGRSLTDMIIYPEPVEGSRSYIISITWKDKTERSIYIIDPGELKFPVKN